MRLLLSLTGICLAVAGQPVPTRTIMDVLSSHAEFSEVVALLQHHELVPLINQVWNATFLAPVNSAFIGLDMNTITREQLLYHLVNATVRAEDIADKTIVYETYLDDGKAPITLNRDKGVNNAVEFDDMDLMASPQRGLVHSLAQLLEIPDYMTKQLYLDPSLSNFSSLIDDESVLDYALALIPEAESMNRDIAAQAGLSSSEPLIQYLRSPFGETDRKKLVRRHVSTKIPIDRDFPLQLRTLDGTKATFYANCTVRVEEHDLEYDSTIHVARNGVYIKLLGLLSAPDQGLIDTTAEKIILGMGGHDLVKALTLYGHRDLINDSHPSEEPHTIVVPTGGSDDLSLVPRSVMSDAPGLRTMVHPGTLILYQFLNSSLPKKAKSKLLDSKMMLRSGKYPQRVRFQRSESGAQSLNWEILGNDAYQWGNTTFYSSAELLTAPPSLLMALGPLLISSYSMAFLDKLDRLQLPVDKSWTVFLPNRDAWERNLLLKDYLDANYDALVKIFDNLILQAPIYSDTGVFETKQYSGQSTVVSWEPEYKEFTIESEGMSANIRAEVTDALFDNGVAHIVNDVPLPVDLEISAEDLITAGGRSLFIELLEAAGMSDVLEPASNFTVLVPPSKDLTKHNFTTETDIKKLRSMLELHVIPGGSLSRIFDGETATTLSGEVLEIRSLDPEDRFFGLTPVSATNGQQVLIFEYGHTNGEISGGSGVMFIDRHISPQWIIPIKFGLRKGTYAIIGAILGLLGALALVFGLFVFVSRQREDLTLFSDEPHYRDDEENGTDDEESDQLASRPIEAPAVAEDRAYGRHLNLPS